MNGGGRVAFNADDGTVVQDNFYYPFGLTVNRLANLSDNKYLYNGKEHETENNLNWYHYGARFYDPQISRWFSIDPADEFVTPYAYVGNNPINLVDPDGRQVEWAIAGANWLAAQFTSLFGSTSSEEIILPFSSDTDLSQYPDLDKSIGTIVNEGVGVGIELSLNRSDYWLGKKKNFQFQIYNKNKFNGSQYVKKVSWGKSLGAATAFYDIGFAIKDVFDTGNWKLGAFNIGLSMATYAVPEVGWYKLAYDLSPLLKFGYDQAWKSSTGNWIIEGHMRIEEFVNSQDPGFSNFGGTQ